MRPGNNFNFDSSTTSSNAASIPPTPDGATFRDLLIFEERLKQNAARLQRRKHKYQGILLLLCAAILLLSYHRIVAANRFVPQANRALRPFNMYLNTRRPPAGDSWLSSLPFIKSNGSAIQPIPPSSNPRGEMIFSSKVSLAFREGYERYRNVFERRRKEKLDA
ncbi:hypothetical protein BCV69DRAFT_244670, partial [Microstroma glucosiphilum]